MLEVFYGCSGDLFEHQHLVLCAELFAVKLIAEAFRLRALPLFSWKKDFLMPRWM